MLTKAALRGYLLEEAATQVVRRLTGCRQHGGSAWWLSISGR